MRLLLLLLLPFTVWAQSSQWNPNVYVDQVGDNNTITITQSDGNHYARVALGANLPSESWVNANNPTMGTTAGSDANYVRITQQGTGDKKSAVEIPNGYSNSIILFQDGVGNHTTTIQNLVGNANSINTSQTGSGNHTLSILGQSGTTNNGNTINSTQSGSGDKNFSLGLNGTAGATVTIQQTNSTQANTGSMVIQCTTCGSYSYVRN
jgi:hypothetical protein